MSAVKRVAFLVVTPDGSHVTRSLPDAMDYIEDQIVNCGHHDGFFVTLTMEVLEGELPEDTNWLERRLGREWDAEQEVWEHLSDEALSCFECGPDSGAGPDNATDTCASGANCGYVGEGD